MIQIHEAPIEFADQSDDDYDCVLPSKIQKMETEPKEDTVPTPNFEIEPIAILDSDGRENFGLRRFLPGLDESISFNIETNLIRSELSQVEFAVER